VSIVPLTDEEIQTILSARQPREEITIEKTCTEKDIKEQEPQKIQQRKDEEEKRNIQEEMAREQKRIEDHRRIRDQEKFENQKRVEEERRSEYGIDYDCFCIEYESFFRFCKKQSVINDFRDDTDILTKWNISGKRAVRLMLSEKYPGVTFSLNGKGGPFRLKWYLQLFMENFARSFGNTYYNRLR
jgi:hypothetical protein